MNSNKVQPQEYLKKKPALNSSNYTVRGALEKSIISLIVLVAAGFVGFSVTHVYPAAMLLAVIVSVIMVPVVWFSVKCAGPTITTIVACAEGFVMGALTHFLLVTGIGAEGSMMEKSAPLIALALIATTSTIFACAFLYFSGTIRVSPKFKKIAWTALLAIFIFSIASFGLSFFFPDFVSSYRTGPIGIIVSVVIIIVASMNLISSFDDMTILESENAEKKYEWQSALTIVVLAVWIYAEILRIIAEFAGDD